MKNKIFVYVFFIFIFIIPIINIFSEDKRISNTENKELQVFPKISIESILNKEFQDDFEEYSSDQIVGRDWFVRGKNYFELLTLKREISGVYLGSDNYYIERHSIKDYDQDKIDENISIIEEFNETYDAEIYLIANANIALNDKLFISNDYDISNIPYVYYDDLDFYKTDHHWTTYAAYNLYKKIVDNPIDYKPVLVNDSFLGTINNKLNIFMKPDSIYKHDSNTNFSVYYDLSKESKGLYFDKYLQEKDKYSYFLDGNHGLVEIVNKDINSDSKILIIKDSYANCFIPFISENYKQVDVIDLRFFNVRVPLYLKAKEYERIIVLYNVDNFLTNTYLKKLSPIS